MGIVYNLVNLMKAKATVEATRQKTLIVLHGLSGAGKSTAANYLATKGIPSTHPIAPYKAFLEQTFRLEPGSLDTPEGKAIIPDGCTHSMLEILIRGYYHYQAVAPSFSAHMLKRTLSEAFDGSHTVSTQSIRNLAEVKTIRDLRITLDLRVSLVTLERNSARKLESDMLYNRISRDLGFIADTIVTIQNDKSTDELFTEIDGALGIIN